MKKRRGLLTEPLQPQARSSRRRCDLGLRHSLTKEYGHVEDSLTVAPRSSLRESAGFLPLVAERPPTVASRQGARSRHAALLRPSVISIGEKPRFARQKER